MRLRVENWAFSFTLAAAVAVIGLIGFTLLPLETSKDLTREGGLIDNTTVVLYFVALAVLWLRTPPGLNRLGRIAISIVLLACVARELDLHIALFGMSILKTNFYRRFATRSQIVVALLLIFPVLLSIGYLLIRHGRWLLSGMRRRWPAAMTTWSIFLLLVLVKILDGLKRFASELGVDGATFPVQMIQTSMEEPLEMILPLLVIIAIVQQWHGMES